MIASEFLKILPIKLVFNSFSNNQRRKIKKLYRNNNEGRKSFIFFYLKHFLSVAAAIGNSLFPIKNLL